MNSATGGRSGTLSGRLKNVVASVAVVAIACSAYAVVPHYRAKLDKLYGWVGFPFTGHQFLLVAASVYSLLLAIYFLTESAPGVSKSLRFWRVIARFVRAPVAAVRSGLVPDDRLAVLATLLKGFFGPMMLIMTLQTFWAGYYNAYSILKGASGAGFFELFNRHGFWFALQLIIFVDVVIFTAGYLVETKRLGNEIRSVDPTVLGWAAALLCYFPFSFYLSAVVLGRQFSDFPQFDDPTTHLVLNIALLALMTVYTGASVALGFKASNLTHRGVVTSGPYALVRHPAYTCKNMAWWIGAIPIVTDAFSQSMLTGITSIASIVGWSMLYVLRALTEEDHLRSVDGEYDAYSQKVRYRFIPGIF